MIRSLPPKRQLNPVKGTIPTLIEVPLSCLRIQTGKLTPHHTVPERESSISASFVIRSSPPKRQLNPVRGNIPTLQEVERPLSSLRNQIGELTPHYTVPGHQNLMSMTHSHLTKS